MGLTEEGFGFAAALESVSSSAPAPGTAAAAAGVAGGGLKIAREKKNRTERFFFFVVSPDLLSFPAFLCSFCLILPLFSFAYLLLIEAGGTAPIGTPWFEFNDSIVRPINESLLESQFQGKESACVKKFPTVFVSFF